MKLAEALILRADCQKRFAQLKARLLVNAEISAQLEAIADQFADLIKRIK